MTQPERITLNLLKELLNNVTRNTNFLFGTETIQSQQHQFYNKIEYFSDRPGLLNAATRISFTKQISQAANNSSMESLFHT